MFVILEHSHIFLEVTLENESFVIGCLYSRDDRVITDLFENLSVSLSDYLEADYKILLGGDMNCHIGEYGFLGEDLTNGTALIPTRKSLHINAKKKEKNYYQAQITWAWYY